jgi:hypothetical protein
MTMFTIVFHDGCTRHVTDAQRSAVLQAVARGEKNVILGQDLLTLSSISRVQPSVDWLRDQQDRLQGTDFRVCDFGRKHGRRDECDCVTRLALPLAPAAAQTLLTDLTAANRDGTLSEVGKALWEKGYPALLASAHPESRHLLP